MNNNLIDKLFNQVNNYGERFSSGTMFYKLNKIKMLKKNSRKCQIVDMDIAIDKINNGKLVSFPTETVYGLGCDISSRSAIESIFKTKNRP